MRFYNNRLLAINLCRFLRVLLALGGQTDSQVGSQVAKSRKFHAYHWLMRFYNNRLLAINLCRFLRVLLALGGQTVKNIRLLASIFELDTSPRKSSQVGGQTKRNLNASPKLASTCEFVRPGFKMSAFNLAFVRRTVYFIRTQSILSFPRPHQQPHVIYSI